MQTDSKKRCCTELILQINVSSPDDAMNFDELVVDYQYGIGAEQYNAEAIYLDCVQHILEYLLTLWGEKSNLIFGTNWTENIAIEACKRMEIIAFFLA